MKLRYLLLISIFQIKGALACTSDSYSVAPGASVNINECGTCKTITNNGSSTIFVPTKTNTEWTAFFTNVTANTGGNVTTASCCSYPLDSVTAPVLAYSLRKLSSTYSGALIRVRRSSDNAEQDIYPSSSNCGMLDTAALTTFVGSNSAFVKTWYDQVGTRHATQTTAGSQPRIVNAGTIDTKFGQTTIFFNGSTLLPSAALGIASTSSWSYTMVIGATTTVNGASNDGNGTYYMDRTSATPALTGLKTVSGKFVLQKRNNSSGNLGGVSTTTSISTTAIQSVYAQRTYNTAYQIFLNNVSEATLAETDGALTPPTPNIGRHVSTTTTSNFGLFELIFWGTVLDSTNRTTVYQSQKSDFGF